MKTITSTLTATIIAGAMACSASVQAAEDVVIVYDASGSMWGQIDGVSKVEIAREVMGDLITKWPDDTNLGLVAYGHRRKGDCSDIETLIAPAPLDKSGFIQTINNIRPNGKTPISASLQHAADLMSYRDSQATIVLISDGLETCHADPCELSGQLAKQGVKLTTHVVGFDLEEDDRASLSCIAENTGGLFVPANNAVELSEALAQVQSAVVAPAPEVDISGPEKIETGAIFDVSWSAAINDRDFITLVPAGADEDAVEHHIRTKGKTEGRLTAPGEPGLYELRYVLEASRKALASAPLEVVQAEMSVSGPKKVNAGAIFDVSWSSVINDRDLITLVPAGADENTVEHHIRTKGKTEGRLTAPGEPGLYELRYVLNSGRKVLASAPLEVAQAETTVSGPEKVTMGAIFDVSWSSVINDRDFITLVPAGADENTVEHHIRTKGKTEGHLTAPGEPGLYELRYVLNSGRKTVGRAPIEVESAEVEINGPDIVRAQDSVDVTWSNTVNRRDFIVLVPTGADEGSLVKYIRTKNNTKGRLKAPDEPGLYELRYVLEAGRKTLASTPLEVVSADALLGEGLGLVAPPTAGAGEVVTIHWTGTAESSDQRVSLARKEQGDFNWISVKSVGEGKSMELSMPKEAGLYEIRFLDITGRKLLDRSVIEVK